MQQATAIALILGLTLLNTRGLWLGKLVQNAFTWAKSLTLLALAAIGILIGRSASAIAANFNDAWTPRDVATITPDLFPLPATSAATGALGLFVAVCVAHAGSIFAADAWNNVTFTAAEVKNPRRNVPLSLAYGTLLVMTLYLLANVAYLCVLPIERIQHAPDDRVATAALEVVFGAPGAAIMAVAIVVSTFGCNNGLVLAGARVCYAMARDGLFFRSTGLLSRRGVPARALALQGLWASLLVLPRIRLHDASGAVARDPASGAPLYGNLYNNLLEYVVFAVLVFYVLTIAALFVLRRTRPHDDRPVPRARLSNPPCALYSRRLHHRRRALPVSHRDLAAGIPHRAERTARVRAVAALRIGGRVTTRRDHARSTPPAPADRLLGAVRELAPAIARRSPEIEEARRLPPDLVEQLASIGFFRMLLPRRWGGLEIDFPKSVEILAELSAADGSVGWTSMIGCETPQLFALLPEATFDAIYADGPDVIVGGAFAPRGTAEAIDDGERGGYRVSGRWSFASGCQHARWLFGNCVVTSGGQPAPGPAAGRAAASLRRAAGRGLDDPRHLAHRGPARHRQPRHRDPRRGGRQGVDVRSLPRRPVRAPATVRSAAAPVLDPHRRGGARHRGRSAARPDRARGDQQAASLRQERVGRLAAVPVPPGPRRGGSRSRAGAAARARRASCGRRRSGSGVEPSMRNKVLQTTAWVAETATRVVDACYTAGGGSALYSDSPLQRRLRDIHALTQHASVQESVFATAGAERLGRSGPFGV